MAVALVPKRIRLFAVVGARTNKGALLENASARQRIDDKPVACVGDTLIDSVGGGGKVSLLDFVKHHVNAAAAPGRVLSNGSFVVDAGQSHVCCAKYEQGSDVVPAAEDAPARGGAA